MSIVVARARQKIILRVEATWERDFNAGKGVTMTEHGDQDLYVRKHYEDELKKVGVASAMP